MNRFLDSYLAFLKATLTLLMGLMIIPVLFQIISRHTGIIPRYIWTEEIARFCFVWIVMIGSMIAVKEGSHFDVNLLPAPKTSRGRGISQLIRHFAMLVLAFVFAWYGIDFAKSGFAQHSEMSGLNMLSIYISFPLAGLSWILFLADKLIHDFKLILQPSSHVKNES